jgi:hypothetical protein
VPLADRHADNPSRRHRVGCSITDRRIEPLAASSPSLVGR